MAKSDELLTASSSGVTESIRLPTLKKQSIFLNWKFRIHLFLEQKGVVEVLQVRLKKKVKKRDDFKKKDSEAKLWIVQSVDDELLDVVRNCTTAQQMIMKLEAHFQRKTAFSKYHLKKQLLTMRLDTSESLQSHFKKFDQLISKLEAIGCKLDESDKVCHLLLTLPEEYKVVITSLDEILSMAESGQLLEFVKTQLFESDVRLKGKPSSESNKENENPPLLEFPNINGKTLFQIETIQFNNVRCPSPVSVATSDRCEQHPRHTALEDVSTPESCGGVVSNHNSPAAEFSSDILSHPAQLHNGLPAAATNSHCNKLIPEHTLNTDTEMNQVNNVDGCLSLNITDRLEYDEPLVLSPGSDISFENDFQYCGPETNPLQDSLRNTGVVLDIKIESDTTDKGYNTMPYTELLDCRVVVENIADTHWCAICKRWSLTTEELQNHKHIAAMQEIKTEFTKSPLCTLEHELHDSASMEQNNSQIEVVELSKAYTRDKQINKSGCCYIIPEINDPETEQTSLQTVISEYPPMSSETQLGRITTMCVTVTSEINTQSIPKCTFNQNTQQTDSEFPMATRQQKKLQALASNVIYNKADYRIKNDKVPVSQLGQPPFESNSIIRVSEGQPIAPNDQVPVSQLGQPRQPPLESNSIIRVAEGQPIAPNDQVPVSQLGQPRQPPLESNSIIRVAEGQPIAPNDQVPVSQLGQPRQPPLESNSIIRVAEGQPIAPNDQVPVSQLGQPRQPPLESNSIIRVAEGQPIAPNDQAPFRCHICYNIFIKKSTLDYHIKDAHSQIEMVILGRPYKRKNKFFCKYCAKGFYCMSKMVTHTVVHTKEKNFKCEICAKSLGGVYALRGHIKRLHSGDKPFACTVCDRRYSFLTTMKQHMKDQHNPDKFECNECGMILKRKHDLINHIQSVHLNAKTRPFKCDVCKKGFKCKKILKHHKIVHSTGTPSFTCDVCGQSFLRKLSFNVHKLTHAEKSFFCDQCGNGFTKKQSLIIHLESHRKDNAFSCKICKKRFKRQVYLDRHEVTHKGRPYSCNVCGQRFFYKSTLNRHMRAPHFEHSGPRRDRNPRK